MNLSISNIAWTEAFDLQMYEHMKAMKYTGLEIAPTRIIHANPYSKCKEIHEFSNEISIKYGLCVSSIQSIWFGKKEQLFSSEDEYQALLDYTKRAIEFASAARCKNIVFGCPKNRNLINSEDENKAISFFNEVGEYALNKDTVFAIEANPVFYGTNFINTTESAFNMLNRVDSKGVKVNLDLGTIIYNNETLSIIEQNVSRINHVHISEPNLERISKRNLHYEIASILKSKSYNRYVSIEMKTQDSIENIIETMAYMMEVFN